jgi:hypothetical protein
MSVTVKLVGFLVALLSVSGAAFGVGRAVGPVAEPVPAAHEGMESENGSHEGMAMGSGQGAEDSPATAVPKGLMVSQNGYTFRLGTTTAAPGADVPVTFTIEGPDGRLVTDFDVEHEKRLHLIVVRRDFTGFQHVHPEMAEDGTWTTTIDLTAGQWRLFADFKARGADPVTLGNDLAVSGAYRPAAPAADSRTATVGDYAVTLDGDLVPGQEAELTLSVTRDGRPVSDLQPYLGAYGHLVALRAGDLAYLHVHPEGTPGDGATAPGPQVTFFAEVPSAGRYLLYLDFQHEGEVRTAAFTVTGTGNAPSGEPETDEAEDGHAGDEH